MRGHTRLARSQPLGTRKQRGPPCNEEGGAPHNIRARVLPPGFAPASREGGVPVRRDDGVQIPSKFGGSLGLTQDRCRLDTGTSRDTYPRDSRGDSQSRVSPSDPERRTRVRFVVRRSVHLS